MSGLRVIESRSCGECDACCVAFDIVDVDLQKKAGDRCANLSGAGCSVYRSRPRSCRDFECLWIKGAGGEEHRPDRCGFVLHERPHPHGGPMVVATELADGALLEGTEGYKVASEIGYQVPVIVMRVDGRRTAIQPAGRFIRPLVLESSGG